MSSIAQPGLTRQRLTGDERRATLLEAALDVFARSGYHAASIDEIARAAGVSKALIYEHFPSKRDLHGSLLEAQVGELFARLEGVAARGGEPEDRLRGGLDTFFGFVRERPEAWRMLFRDAAEPEVVDQFRRVQAQATALIAALMESEMPATDADAHRLVEMLAAQLSGAMQALANWWLERPDVSREDLVAAGIDFAWTGLASVRDRLAARRAGA